MYTSGKPSVPQKSTSRRCWSGFPSTNGSAFHTFLSTFQATPSWNHSLPQAPHSRPEAQPPARPSGFGTWAANSSGSIFATSASVRFQICRSCCLGPARRRAPVGPHRGQKRPGVFFRSPSKMKKAGSDEMVRIGLKIGDPENHDETPADWNKHDATQCPLYFQEPAQAEWLAAHFGGGRTQLTITRRSMRS